MPHNTQKSAGRRCEARRRVAAATVRGAGRRRHEVIWNQFWCPVLICKADAQVAHSRRRLVDEWRCIAEEEAKREVEADER